MNTNSIKLNQSTFKSLPKSIRKFIIDLQKSQGWSDQQLFNSGWSFNPNHLTTGQFTLN